MAKELFIYALKDKFIQLLENNEVDSTQVGIIPDTSEIWVNGEYLPLVYLSTHFQIELTRISYEYEEFSTGFQNYVTDQDAIWDRYDAAITAYKNVLQTNVGAVGVPQIDESFISIQTEYYDSKKELYNTISAGQKTLITTNANNIAEIKSYTPEILQNENEVAIKVGNNTSGYTTINYSKFSNDLTGRIEATPEEFTFRPSAGDKSIRDDSAFIKKIKGNTIVWNQLVNISNPVRIDFSENTNVYYQILGRFNEGIRITKGHKYIGTGYVETNIETRISFGISSSMQEGQIITSFGTGYYERIFNASTDKDSDTLFVNNYAGQHGFLQGDYISCTLNLFDLTQMFGAGNEPTTVEEFKALFPNNYYDYNAGELVSMTSKGLFANGFNQFNGEYAEVLPNNAYYLGGTYTTIGFAEEIGGTLEDITIPTDKLYTPTKKGYIYATGINININLSHTGVRNGEYEPYWDATKDLSIIQKYFPNGMRGAGSIYDEISFDEATQKWVAIQRVGSVDLGSLSWYVSSGYEEKGGFAVGVPRRAATQNIVTSIPYSRNFYWSNFDKSADNVIYTSTNTKVLFAKYTNYTDVTSFKSAISGVMLYYELAEPIITTIEEPIDLSYKVGDFGIEKMLSDSFSAPFKADIIYQFNATDRVRENSMNISKLSKKQTLLESEVYNRLSKAEALTRKVEDGSVVVENTLSALDENSNKPVSGKAVAKAIEIPTASAMYLEQGSISTANGQNQRRIDSIAFAKRVRTAGYIDGATTVVANEGIIVRTAYRYSLDGIFETAINPEPSNTFTTSNGYKWRLAFAKSNIDDFINVEDVFGKTLASTLDVSLHNVFYPIKDSAAITFTEDSVTIGVGEVAFRRSMLGVFSFNNAKSITFEFANAPAYSYYVLDYHTLEFKNVTNLLPSYIVLLEFNRESKISGGVWAGWYSDWYSEITPKRELYSNLSHDYYRDGVKRLSGYITPSVTNTTSVSYQRTEEIIVDKGDIIRWRSSCYSDTYALAYYDTSKKLIDGVFGASHYELKDYEYVVPNNGYIVFSFAKANGLAFHIEKSVNSQNMIIPTFNAGKRYSKMRDFGTQPAADGSSGSFMNIADDYNSLINNIYEPLRTANPDYISRVSAGKDATGTYEQWVYTFEPLYWQQSILLVGGVHANEEDAIAGLARIMQMITNEYEGDEDLTYIRQNVKITVVPVVNVWGYSQSPKVRTNADNQSIQTWNSNTPIAEVANLKPIFTALAPELAFAVDMHTTTNNSYLDFYGVINKYCKNVRTLFRANAWLTQHYAIEGGVKEQLFGFLNSPHLLGSWLFGELEVPASTLELSDYHWDTAKATSKVQTMGVTMWLNYIIQQINDNYNPAQFIDEADYKIVKG